METASLPREHQDWRTSGPGRAEDAAYLFGYYLILHCRDEAIAKIPANASPDTKAAVEVAVDTALHNVCDLLEGFWPLEAGPKKRIALALGVQVGDEEGDVVETVEISPCKLDLPIGYWKWAQDREFR